MLEGFLKKKTDLWIHARVQPPQYMHLFSLYVLFSQ